MNSNNYNSLVKIASDYDHYDYLEKSRNEDQNLKYPKTKPSKTGGIPLTRVADIEKGMNDQWNTDKWKPNRWPAQLMGDQHKVMKVPFIQGQGSPVGFNLEYGIKGDPRDYKERGNDSALAQRQAISENDRRKAIVRQNLRQMIEKQLQESQERAKMGLPPSPKNAIGRHTLYMNPDGSVNEAQAQLDAIQSGIARWNMLKGHPLNPAEARHLTDKYGYINAQLEDGVDSIDPALYLTAPGDAAIEAHNANKPEEL